ncbi:DUF885 family protein [Erysipelotrichaceae bacterium OH741_COT-311]|nr:DUF885 family protein [Erysipelotrichaceae bacterium OH741_COT-311]
MFFIITMKKIIILILSFSFLFGCSKSKITPTSIHEETMSFNEFLDEELNQYIYADNMSYQRYYVNTFDYHDVVKKPRFAKPMTIEDYQKSYETLLQYNRDDLNTYQQASYDAYAFYLKNKIEQSKYPYFTFAFQPSEKGVTYTVFENLAFYRFDNVEEFRQYLALFDEVEAYFQEGLEFSKKQKEVGYIMPTIVYEEAISFLDLFLNETYLDVYNNFDYNVEYIFVSDDAKQELVKEFNAKVETLIDQVKALKEELLQLKEENVPYKSIVEYPHGKEYARSLIQFNASGEVDPDELYQTLVTFLDDQFQKHYDLLYGDAYNEFYEFDIDMSLEEIMNHLKANYTRILPEVKDLNYDISYFEEWEESYLDGYFLPGYLDSPNANVIKINEKNVDSNIDLYSVLAHEALPGHMYEYSFSNTYGKHPIHYAFRMMAYSEGWAMFSEILALEWLEMNPEVRDLIRYYIFYDYVTGALLDLQVNYYNMSFEEIKAFYSKYETISDEDIELMIEGAYKEPFGYISYGYGLYYFYTQSVNAMDENNLSLQEFLQVVLSSGERPLIAVSQDIEKYMKNK